MDEDVWEPSPAARRKGRHKTHKGALAKPSPAATQSPQRRLSAARATNAEQVGADSQAGSGSSSMSQRIQSPGSSLQDSQQPPSRGDASTSAANRASVSARAHTEKAGRVQAWQGRDLPSHAVRDIMQGKARLTAQQASTAASASLDEPSGRLSGLLADDFPVLGGASASPARPVSSGADTAPTPWASTSLTAERREPEANLDSQQVLRDLGLVSLEERGALPPESLPNKTDPPQQASSSSREDLEDFSHLLAPPQRPRPWPLHHLQPLYSRDAGFHNPHSSVFSGERLHCSIH